MSQDDCSYKQPTISGRTRLNTGDWRRTKVHGSVPTVLKIAQWALSPSNPNKDGKVSVFGVIDCGLRIFLVGLPLQIMLTFPTTASSDDGDIANQYTEFPSCTGSGRSMQST